jgi:hypothetical protein
MTTNFSSRPVYPGGPRMVYEERTIDKYQSTEGVVADLQAALEEGFTSFDVEIYRDYSDYCSKIVVSRNRPETESEREAREIQERRRDEQQRVREMQEYERLKAKFGNL